MLALALDLPYYFEDLSLLGWASSVSVELGRAVVDYKALLAGFGAYR